MVRAVPRGHMMTTKLTGSGQDPVDDGEELAALMEMGFSRAMCVAALKVRFQAPPTPTRPSRGTESRGPQRQWIRAHTESTADPEMQRCSSVNEAAEFLLLNQDLGMDEAAPVAPASSPALVRASHPEERLHTHYDGSDLEYPALGSRTSRAVTGKVLQPQAKRPAQTQLIEYPPTYSDGALPSCALGQCPP